VSQNDYFGYRAVPVEFTIQEEFSDFPKTDRLSVTIVTNGKATLEINGKKSALISPCVFLSSRSDEIEFINGEKFSAKSFSFHPTFVNKSLTFERLAGKSFNEIADAHDSSLLNPFFLRDEFYNGVIKLLPQAFLRISESFDLIGREIEIKGGEHWPYNIRRYLIQMLFLLQDAYSDQRDSNMISDESMTDIVLEYIRTNYSRKISIDTLCGLVYVNRTTLTRKFKARTGKPPIDYLLHHRLNIACEMLTHSRLSISKIAEASGFSYETYLIRQFTSKIGTTPAEYRQSEGFETLNVNESRIFEEF